MKWFKHHSDSSGNLKLKKIKRNFGMVGYGFYWELLELVAEQGDNFKLLAKKDWISEICERTFLKNKKVLELLNAIADEGLIDSEALKQGDLYVPKMEEYQDEYTKKVRTKSRQAPENILLEEEEEGEEEEKKNKKDTSEPKVSQDIPNIEIPEFINLWNEINPAYRKFFENKTERKAVADLLKISPLKDWVVFLPLLQKMNTEQYAKGKSTKPTELLRNIGHFKAWIDQKRAPDPKRKIAVIPND